MGKFYAVRDGRIPGIYLTWDECRKQVTGYSGAVYKSFATRAEAEDFMNPPQDGFSPDASQRAVAYVDGSYRHDKKMFSYGAVIFYGGKEYCFSQAYDDKELAVMRNVAGEIMGSRRAMEFCIENGISELELYYDYAGIEKWCSGEWQTNKSGTIDYKAYYDSLSGRLRVKFVKVKGHSGNKYNDMADALAKKALGIESEKAEKNKAKHAARLEV